MLTKLLPDLLKTAGHIESDLIAVTRG